MSDLRRGLSLPLLVKDLTEMAARRRTFLLRSAFAAVLYLCFGFFFHDALTRFEQSGSLGHGQRLLEPLMGINFIAIYALLPAILAPAIAGEKERGTLDLIFTTDLGRWSLLTQKLLSRLVPVFSLLLLSLPAMALAYALGGIQTNHILCAAWCLLLTCLQVAAVGLAASAYCVTVPLAFLSTYLLLAILYGAPFILLLSTRARWLGDLCFGLLPAIAYFEYGERGRFLSLAAYSPLTFGTILASFLAARWFLVRRAAARPRNRLRQLLQATDRLFDKANRLAGNIVLVRDDKPLPEEDPIVWRESRGAGAGRLRHTIRITFVLELAVVAIALAALWPRGPWSPRGYLPRGAIASAEMGFWILAAVTMVVLGTHRIAGERSRGTLHTLLACPLPSGAILRAKVQALRRLFPLAWTPLLTLALFQAVHRMEYFHFTRPDYDLDEAVYHLVATALSLLLYLPLLSWLGILFGLRFRTNARATIGALAFVAAWCALPILLLGLLRFSLDWLPHGAYRHLVFLSPAALPALTATGTFTHYPAPWGLLAVHTLWYGMLWAVLRGFCIHRADSLLRQAP